MFGASRYLNKMTGYAKGFDNGWLSLLSEDDISTM